MRTRVLALTCGTTMSLLAGSLIAQQEQPRSGQPVQERPTTPGGDIRSTGRSTTNTTGIRGDEPALLRDLVGVWRVDVVCNTDKFMEHGRNRDRDMNNPANRTPATTTPSTTNPSGTRNDTSTTDNPNDPNNPNRVKDPFKRTDEPNTPGTAQPNQPSGNQPANNQPGADRERNRDLNSNNTPNTNRDTQNQPGVPGQASIPGGKTFSGYAETKLVLGGNILQQTIVVPDMMQQGLDGPRRDNVPGAGIAANDQMYRGMSFIAFDNTSNEYGIVFLDSRQGTIHCDRGTYDESARRLVFNGKEGSEMSAPKDDMHKMGHGNVRVVLEVLSPTQHRVTMYASDRSTSGNDNWKNPNDIQLRNPAAPERTTDRGTGPVDGPGANNHANSDVNKLNRDNNDPNANRDQPGTTKSTTNTQPGNTTTRSTDLTSGTIIYQATYTKVSDNNDMMRYRRLLQEPGTPDLNNNDLNRNNDANRNPNDRRDTTTPSGRPGDR